MSPPRLLRPGTTEHSVCSEEPGCPPPSLLPPPLPLEWLPPPPPASSPPASHDRSTFVTALIVAGSVLAFLAVCLSVFVFVRRRRQRREALLEAALAAPPAALLPPDGPGEDVVHHAWHIRTVGLDEAAIESIALTRQRNAGDSAAAACAVCLGEFRDGELLRLLPKCAHAFHVPCIDTWLRAHVNCPLCRADVMGPAAVSAAAEEQPDPPPGASAEQAASSMETTTEREHEQPEQHASELHVQIDQRSSSPERPGQHQHQHGPRAHNFRRVASMDSPSPMASSAEEAPEDEHAGSEKEEGDGGAACRERELPGCGRLKNRPAMKRSLSAGSRWALLRGRSLVLPL